MLPAHEILPFSLARFRKHGAHLRQNMQKKTDLAVKNALRHHQTIAICIAMHVCTIPYITLSRDRRRRPRHHRHYRSRRRRCRHGRVVMASSPCVVAVSSPCRRNAVAKPSACGHRVVAMSSQCRRQAVCMWSPCRRHVVAMPSPSCPHLVAVSLPCRRNAVAMLPPCHGHVVVMPSPFAPTKLATDPLVHTRNLCPQASRIYINYIPLNPIN